METTEKTTNEGSQHSEIQEEVKEDPPKKSAKTQPEKWKVYTKKGDKGKTDIIGQRNVSKSDHRIICYGEVDELNSSIGFCCALIKDYKDSRYQEMLDSIKIIQNDLFNLGTMLAVSEDADTKNFPNIESKDIKVNKKKSA